MKKTWAVSVQTRYCTILAQGDSSYCALLERLKRDDPVWWQDNVRRVRMNKWARRFFNKNLAIRAQ